MTESNNERTAAHAAGNLLRPDQWAEAERYLHFVKPTLLAGLDPPSADIRGMGTDYVVTTAIDDLRRMGTWLKATVADTDAALKRSDVPGGLHDVWDNLKRGYLAELRDRHALTTQVWKDMFDTSPLDETAHGQAQFSKKALANVEKIADSAQKSARAASTSAKLAQSASKSARVMFYISLVSMLAAVGAAVAAGFQAYFAGRDASSSRDTNNVSAIDAAAVLATTSAPANNGSGLYTPVIYERDGGVDANRGLASAAMVLDDAGRPETAGAKRGQNSHR